MNTEHEEQIADFGGLTPDVVLNAVEDALGVRCTNMCRPMNSYINRVYEVGLTTGEWVIAKFYRPGRWSREALQDELDFLEELHADEVPVVPPVPGTDGALLHEWSHIRFAVFPKKGGRPMDGPTQEEWIQLGRLIARMHVVGSRKQPRDRIRLHPQHATLEHVQYILASDTVTSHFRDAYERSAMKIIALISPLFEETEAFRIHADCHFGNILHRPGEGVHLLDFDDLSVGPAVQDLWLMLPDRVPRAREEVNLLLEGYEMFRSFPYDTLRLVEPLRAMRYIHYTAWCARQKADGRYARLPEGWGGAAFWRQEIADVDTQYQEILDNV